MRSFPLIRIEIELESLIPIFSLYGCNQHEETIIHMMRDCLKSREVWQSFIPVWKHQSFIGAHLQQWIKSNVEDDHGIGTSTNTEWQPLFVSIGWHIWKARHEEIFERKQFSSFSVSKLATYCFCCGHIYLYQWINFLGLILTR